MRRSLFVSLVLVVGTLLLVLQPFFKNQLINTDDGEIHAARSANYYLALQQGQLPPRWAPNFSDSYGNPVFMFSYHLPYMVTTFLYVFANVSFQFAHNLLTVFCMIGGAVGVWVLAGRRSLSTAARTIAALLYTLAPYVLITVFLRGAYGEIVFLGLLPWICWLVETLLTKQKRAMHTIPLQILYVGGLAAFLLTHPPSLFVAAPLFASYVWFLAKHRRITFSSKQVRVFLMASMLGVSLTTWFWVPALLETKYIMMSNNQVLPDFAIEFPSLRQLLLPQLLNSDLFGVRKMVTVGYPLLLVVIAAGISIWKKKKLSFLARFWLWWFLIGLFIASPLSAPLWKIVTPLQYMQFPWRMLWLTTFAGTMLFIELWGTQVISQFWKRTVLVGLGVTLAFSVLNYSRYRGIQQWSDYELLEYFKQGSSFNEHQPIWASAFTRKYPTERLSLRQPHTSYFDKEIPKPASSATISDLQWGGSMMSYTVETQETVEVVQKTYYFPGWKVLMNDQETSINYTDEEFPGHIIFEVPRGKHAITVKFTNDTPARKIGDIITVVGMGATGLYGLYLLSSYVLQRKKS